MASDLWTRWPSREALAAVGIGRARFRLGRVVRAVVVAGLLVSTFTGQHVGAWGATLRLGGGAAIALWLWCFHRTTRNNRLLPSVGLLVLLVCVGLGLQAAGAAVAAAILWCACGVIVMERLPLAAALPCALVLLGTYAFFDHQDWFRTAVILVGLLLAGYVPRLDSEARGTTQRLLVQERAARSAEAESAALEERGRIAREIHDVLAHSLSAQLVHLEAARLLIDRSEDLEGDRERLREQVVSARRMAREGLDGTRQALSALRGDMVPLEEHLRQLAHAESARLEITGLPRPLPPETGLAVRRAVQEALTNVRKHAPGARATVRLAYREGEVELLVTDTGGTGGAGELGVTGSGYGLLGMRERAELLGGTVESGPGEEGFTVRMRVPG